MRRLQSFIAVSTLCAVVAGCQQKNENAGQTATPEPSQQQPVSKVEKALASAVGAGKPTMNSGPPPDGILEPARAEAEAPSGSAPKLTMGSNGNAPRFKLRNPRPILPRAMKVEVTLQSGMMDQGVPPIEIGIGLESKPATLAPKPVGEKTEDKTSVNLLGVVAKVRDIKVNMPNVPQDFASQLAGLKGGKVSFTLSNVGGAYGFASDLAAGAKPELRDLLESVAEALALSALPVPSEPVGEGAFWMIVAREKAAGFGLVGYHMVKLLRADEKGADLELDSRRYAVGPIIDPALLPPGSENATLKEISAGVKATIHLVPDLAVSASIEASANLRGTIDSGEGAPKRALQSGTNYRTTVTR